MNARLAKPWVGVDLDGTLAEYDRFDGPRAIGRPIAGTVARVKRLLDLGITVKIFTARVGPTYPAQVASARDAILVWSYDVFGVELDVTHEKDAMMIELWDDRAVQFAKNGPALLDDLGALLVEMAAQGQHGTASLLRSIIKKHSKSEYSRSENP